MKVYAGTRAAREPYKKPVSADVGREVLERLAVERGATITQRTVDPNASREWLETVARGDGQPFTDATTDEELRAMVAGPPVDDSELAERVSAVDFYEDVGGSHVVTIGLPRDESVSAKLATFGALLRPHSGGAPVWVHVVADAPGRINESGEDQFASDDEYTQAAAVAQAKADAFAYLLADNFPGHSVHVGIPADWDGPGIGEAPGSAIPAKPKGSAAPAKPRKPADEGPAHHPKKLGFWSGLLLVQVFLLAIWNLFRTELRTTAGRDFQSQVMGGGLLDAAQILTATAATATTVTFSTQATWATDEHRGKICVVTRNAAGAGSNVYGVILANSTTVITVDKWYSAQDPGGAAATTPDATGAILVCNLGAPCWWMAVTEDTGQTIQNTEIALTAEMAIDGFVRAMAGYSHTTASTSFALAKTFTSTKASGSSTLTRMALFNSSRNATGQFMVFFSAIPSPPVLILNDQVTITDTIDIISAGS